MQAGQCAGRLERAPGLDHLDLLEPVGDEDRHFLSVERLVVHEVLPFVLERGMKTVDATAMPGVAQRFSIGYRRSS
jgi:hypothetical protein